MLKDCNRFHVYSFAGTRKGLEGCTWQWQKRWFLGKISALPSKFNGFRESCPGAHCRRSIWYVEHKSSLWEFATHSPCDWEQGKRAQLPPAIWYSFAHGKATLSVTNEAESWELLLTGWGNVREDLSFASRWGWRRAPALAFGMFAAGQ